jgi:general stress protein 26
MKPELENRLRQCFGGARKVVSYLGTVDPDRNFAPEVRPVTMMEWDWRFFIATSQASRKAHELMAHPKVAALVHFRTEKYSGYLRITGTVEPVLDEATRRAAAEVSGYEIGKYWNGYSDPTLYFARIVPDRVEFMEPGEDVATNVTAEFPQ